MPPLLVPVALALPEPLPNADPSYVPHPRPAPALQQDDKLAASLNGLIGWLFCEPNPIPL